MRNRLYATRAGVLAGLFALGLAGGCGDAPLPPPVVIHEAVESATELPEPRFQRIFSETQVPAGHVLLSGEHRWPAHRFYDSGRRTLELSAGGFALGGLVRAGELSPQATGVMILCESGGVFTQRRIEFEEDVTQAYLDEYRVEVNTDPAHEYGVRTARVHAVEIVPTPWEFVSEPVEAPVDGVLEFSYAIEEWSPSPAQLRVYIVEGDQQHQVWEAEISPKDSPGWREATVSLARWSGREVRVMFRTDLSWPGDEAPPERAWTRPVWGSPLVYAGSPADAAREPSPPNIILISIDTLRADHLGTYGYPLDTSPNIDAFAETAVVFENAMSPSPWTLPAHAAMMTGLDPTQQTGSDEHFYRLGDGLDMIAEIAARNGYVTAGFTDGVLVGGDIGFAQGFDRYYDGPGHVDAPVGTSKEVFERSLAWLEGRDHLPFFLFAHTYEVHWPYEPLEPYLSRFAPGIDPKAVKRDDHSLNIQLYNGEIAHTDHQFGRFLEGIRALGLLDNTIVIVTSDHGEEFGERGNFWHMNTVHRESMHVPLIVHLPSASLAPARVETAVSITDLFATLLDAMEADHPERYDSHSLMPLLLEDAGGMRYSRTLVPKSLRHLPKQKIVVGSQWDNLKYVAEGSFEPPAASLGRGRYRQAELGLLERLSAGPESGTVLRYQTVNEYLFNVEDDPEETEDISSAHPTQVEAGRERLMEYLRDLAAALKGARR
jgi:arylsulfatase A-like enzyme